MYTPICTLRHTVLLVVLGRIGHVDAVRGLNSIQQNMGRWKYLPSKAKPSICARRLIWNFIVHGSSHAKEALTGNIHTLSPSSEPYTFSANHAVKSLYQGNEFRHCMCAVKNHYFNSNVQTVGHVQCMSFISTNSLTREVNNYSI